MRISAVLVAVTAFSFGVAEDRHIETGDAVSEVLALNDRLTAAARSGDVATLRELLSDQLVVSPPDNSVRGRDELLSLFSEGTVKYSSVETTIDHAGQIDDLVVIMGNEVTVVEAVPAGNPWVPGTTLRRRYTNVYRRESDGWRLLVKQSTVFSVDPP